MIPTRLFQFQATVLPRLKRLIEISMDICYTTVGGLTEMAFRCHEQYVMHETRWRVQFKLLPLEHWSKQSSGATCEISSIAGRLLTICWCKGKATGSEHTLLALCDRTYINKKSISSVSRSAKCQVRIYGHIVIFLVIYFTAHFFWAMISTWTISTSKCFVFYYSCLLFSKCQFLSSTNKGYHNGQTQLLWWSPRLLGKTNLYPYWLLLDQCNLLDRSRTIFVWHHVVTVPQPKLPIWCAVNGVIFKRTGMIDKRILGPDGVV